MVPLHAPAEAVSVVFSCAVPVMVGALVFDGGVTTGEAAVTVAVCAEAALALPALLVAVTLTRIVLPTSSLVSVYVEAAAGMMSTQFAPDVSQRLHWYAYESGVVPFQPPVDADNVWLSCGVPEIVGAALFVGATTAGAVAVTVVVGAEVALALPALFVAVTTTRIVLSTSAVATL